MDTHAGGGLYTLGEKGEWLKSAQRLNQILPNKSNHFLSSLNTGLSEGTRYFGSWALAAKILTELGIEVSVKGYDIDPAVIRVARQNWSDLNESDVVNGTAEFVQGNGYDCDAFTSKGSGGSAEVFDLVFVDPPYSGGGDWSQVEEIGRQLIERGSPFLIWYPFFWATKPDHLTSRLGLPSYEMHWSKCGPKPSQNLKGCGVIAGGSVDNYFRSMPGKLGEFCNELGLEFSIRNSI
ncbi:MAG: 23S rRNA (adenine(2030)-N(6))-methyltransferase RlmJ [Bacteroidetes Order II. Incertae sedis bacterium]|nr:23S rRNA (adenine(2030)-N(6))-methyltransferase RlmJ [Bacteroidetes Order II. bacterium]